MPAPSVAVKIPPTIPPITMMIRSRLGIASKVTLIASFIGVFPEVGIYAFCVNKGNYHGTNTHKDTRNVASHK